VAQVATYVLDRDTSWLQPAVLRPVTAEGDGGVAAKPQDTDVTGAAFSLPRCFPPSFRQQGALQQSADLAGSGRL